MKFPAKLKALREAKQLTQEQLAGYLQISKSAISMYEQGNREPDFETLEAIADFFNADMNYLPGGKHSLPIADWGAPTLTAYTKTTAVKQEGVCDILRIPLISPFAYDPEPETEVFHISEQPAAAGTGVYLGPESFCEIHVNIHKLPHGAIFGIPVRGDSMEPRYKNGDIIIVSKDVPVVGEIGVFTLGGQNFVKKLGDGVLLSLNGKYSPIPMDETIRCNGKVVGVLNQDWVVG